MDNLQAAEKSIQKAKEIAEKCPYRPAFHFLAPANWMNDPNGPIFYKGEYHLFYQHNPYEDKWGQIHWGHAKSQDLVHWDHLPLALIPSNELGEEHCFSGYCIISDGVPTIIYTSIGLQKNPSTSAEQWLASSPDDMKTWQKSRQNPILTLDVHKDLDVRDWRDPYVWREKDYWYMILGGHIHNTKTGATFLYKSKNLMKWEYIHPLYQGKKISKMTGMNWECPNFFHLGETYVLIVSPHKKVIYNVGNYKNHKFIPGNWRYLDHGRVFYAANTMIDTQGRIIMWAWVRGGGTGGWNGCLTLPRILTLDQKRNLRITPAPELQILRTSKIHLEDINISPLSSRILKEIHGKCLEIVAEFEIINPGEFGFKIFQSKDRKQFETIKFNMEKKQLSVGKEKGKIESPINKQKIIFHIFIDKSVIEVFFNYSECLTSRIYPISDSFENIEIYATDGIIRLASFDIWELKSIW